MRLRPFVALSVTAAAALLLAGCAAGGGDTSAPDPSGAAAADLCSAQAASGPVSESVVVDGEAGTPSTATFTAPLDVTALEATVVAEGSGDPVASGDFIAYALTAYDAQSGQKLGDLGYEPGQVLPQQISADGPLGQILGCGAPGERVVATIPPSGAEGDANYIGAAIYIFDLLDKVPTAAWGEQQPAVPGMPTVTLGDDGTPSITIDTTATPPATTDVATLKKGDGYTIQSGDQVLIQFRGARWSTGELFDGGDTWATNTPYTGTTTGFVAGFQKALDGQTVGSQMLVVISPEDGYGVGEINEKDLKGDTLVFVIDILGAQQVAAAQ